MFFHFFKNVICDHLLSKDLFAGLAIGQILDRASGFAK